MSFPCHVTRIFRTEQFIPDVCLFHAFWLGIASVPLSFWSRPRDASSILLVSQWRARRPFNWEMPTFLLVAAPFSFMLVPAFSSYVVDVVGLRHDDVFVTLCSQRRLSRQPLSKRTSSNPSDPSIKSVFHTGNIHHRTTFGLTFIAAATGFRIHLSWLWSDYFLGLQ